MVLRDRDGRESDNYSFSDRLLNFFYNTKRGRLMLGYMIRPGFSAFMGKVLDSRVSRVLIHPYVKSTNMDMSEYVPTKYKSYNQFFTRHIKPENRPLDPDPNVLISPSDGKVLIYPISGKLVVNIKGNNYSIKSLLTNTELSEEYYGGYMYVIRLSPDDYHRYVYSVGGRKSNNVTINGIYHTVKPIAFELTNVYYENTRCYTIIDSEVFGRVIQMEVGALAVGRIVNLMEDGVVQRGTEKGYFEFGGSTIILLVKKDMVIPDEDILKNSFEDVETVVKVGERIGIKA